MNFDAVIRRDENRKYVAYPDPKTKGPPWTIGEGHTGPEVHEGLVWDDAQIDFAKQLDMASATQACFDHFPWFATLPGAAPVGGTSPLNARQVVLASMMFQMGPTRTLGFHDTLAAFRDAHYAHAAQCMKDSAWGHQTPARVARLAQQAETGEWQ